MHLEVIIAGFGGQGILLAGQLLAEAGMLAGKQVSWVPSYGPEMRGGVANCAVVLSDEVIGSPVVGEPDVAIAMNRPSMDKFSLMVKPGGTLFINSSLMKNEVTRKDITVIEVPCNDIADELGSVKVATLVAIGALLEKTGALTPANIVSALRELLPERRHNLIPLNEKALERGAEIVRAAMASVPC